MVPLLPRHARKVADEPSRCGSTRYLHENPRAPGFSTYSIFLHPETRQLFGYAEIENEEQWASIGATEICQKWWKHMGDIMPSNPDHSPVSAPLREVFHLD
jgi:L-rhamnose mutarotase